MSKIRIWLTLGLCAFICMLTVSRAAEPAFRAQEVRFPSADKSVTLAGTLTLPSRPSGKPLAAAILLTGTGAQDRDETVAGQKPFKIIAEYLSPRGIAVLRFDDRGVGQSTGEFKTATIFDFAEDARGALAYLKTRPDIDPSRTVLIGHSEGGLTAGIVAAGRADLGGVVLLAAPGIPVDELLLEQTELIMLAGGASRESVDKALALSRDVYAIIKSTPDREAAFGLIRDRMIKFGMDPVRAVVNARLLTSDWFVTLLKTVPADYYSRITVPTLVLNGSKDLQVPPGRNLAAIREALTMANITDAEFVEFEGLNHLFQQAETGHPNEYGRTGPPMVPVVLETIETWMTSRFKP